MLPSPRLLLAGATLLSLLPSASAQQAADGLIVPFSSGLPSCASQCGPLWDAQGACSGTGIPTSPSCFCAYSTLQPFLTTTAGVCDYACTSDPTGLTSIRDWFLDYCHDDTTTSTTSTNTTTTGTSDASVTDSDSGSSSGQKSWLDTHWKWVIFVVVVTIAFVGGWIGAYYLRKRIIRHREKQMEMSPPVAWGPHQHQSHSGGYGDGVVNAGTVGVAGRRAPVGTEKMSPSNNAPAPSSGKKGRTWLGKNRDAV